MHKILSFELLPDELVVFFPKKLDFKAFLFILIISYALLITFWNIIESKIFIKFGVLGIIITIGILIFAISRIFDTFLFPKLIVTNKRIIKKHHSVCTEILLNDIECVTMKQLFNFGTITITTKNGYIFHSPIISYPNNVKAKIENFIKPLNS